ncbi:hypothetical protein [Ancylobacter lacus]|uniref:hypothetical protein n=1 Tax=Ancylobacter lacus TaxID=2579970 RepID=UPI001BCDCF34|nr:hypothetical protein [Ancylobacter lacus]MBS7537968.1 hypothetical protein [Ancylobacter lacus]
MIKILVIGLWVCAVTLMSSYGGARWAAGTPLKTEEKYLQGLEYRRLDPINVPMIIDGDVKGYVVARLVMTADAELLHRLPIEPQIFLINEAFDEIYMHARIEFGQLAKYNLNEIMEKIKSRTNERLKGPVVQDVLVDAINYIDKTEIRSLAQKSRSSKPETSKTASSGSGSAPSTTDHGAKPENSSH